MLASAINFGLQFEAIRNFPRTTFVNLYSNWRNFDWQRTNFGGLFCFETMEAIFAVFFWEKQVLFSDTVVSCWFVGVRSLWDLENFVPLVLAVVHHLAKKFHIPASRGGAYPPPCNPNH